MKPLSIGLVSPYDWSVPGGVQIHIRDLAGRLIGEGHRVSVLTPDSSDEDRDAHIVSVGRSIAVPYNGAVARLAFGPIANSRVRRWISEGDFDVLHLHEPAIPSLSLLACWAATGPMVGTFHAAYPQSWAMNVAAPMLEPAMDKLSARIAVSDSARASLVEHLGGDAVVIPNGVHTALFTQAIESAKYSSKSIAFLGRFEEPRKGFDLLVSAVSRLLEQGKLSEYVVLVAGRGEADEELKRITKQHGEAVAGHFRFLGEVDDEAKASLLKSATIYVAPNTGGESFGIIIAEAMAAGAVILASDLPAFVDVLDQAGAYFSNENVVSLAEAMDKLLSEPSQQERFRSASLARSAIFDWKVIVPKITAIYEMVTSGSAPVAESTNWRRRGE